MSDGNESIFRSCNFSAGPSCLPLNVLQEAQNELLSYQGTGMSFMEMSHRDATGPVQQTITATSLLVRELLNVPDNYHILFAHGGAHGQFAAVPMNIAYEAGKIDFVNCGVWSQKAMGEASKFADVRECAVFTNGVVDASQWNYRPDSAYIHICLNETMTGIEILNDPVLPPDAPVLVGDATSTLFSRPINISRYGIIYASAGKNFGPAGMCIVIVRDDLLQRTRHPCTPGLLDYRESVNSKPIPNIYNTPPCFQIYMTKKVLANVKALGGIEEMERKAIERSSMIYKVFDESNGYYINNVEKSSRSRMNMCFRIGGPNQVELEKLFVSESEKAGLFQLFGHPVYGGLRITIYNGQEDHAVEKVRNYLLDFAASHPM